MNMTTTKIRFEVVTLIEEFLQTTQFYKSRVQVTTLVSKKPYGCICLVGIKKKLESSQKSTSVCKTIFKVRNQDDIWMLKIFLEWTESLCCRLYAKN